MTDSVGYNLKYLLLQKQTLDRLLKKQDARSKGGKVRKTYVL